MERGNPFGQRTKGFPLPKPHPFPKRALFRKMEAADKQRSPFAHSPPAHHNNDGKKAWGRKPPTLQKTVGRMASNTPLRVRQNIYLKTRPAPLPEKMKAPPRVRQNTKSPAHRPSRATSSFPPGHTPATPPLTKASFPATSPRPSPPYIGGPAAKAARRITRHCQKTIRAVFGGWGSLRGKGPFFRQEKGPSPSNQSVRSPDSPQ